MTKKATIYTRTGDEGQTSLFAGGRTSKSTARLHAYGTIDELNSTVGFVITQQLSADMPARLVMIQNELFVVGADLATPLESTASWITRITEEQVTRLEHEIDLMDEQLPPLKNFVLPGGTPGAAALHIARTVCRRAERWIVALGDEEKLNPSVLHYVNRLSDWLFVAARFENVMAGHEETIWRAPHG